MKLRKISDSLSLAFKGSGQVQRHSVLQAVAKTGLIIYDNSKELAGTAVLFAQRFADASDKR